MIFFQIKKFSGMSQNSLPQKLIEIAEFTINCQFVFVVVTIYHGLKQYNILFHFCGFLLPFIFYDIVHALVSLQC